MAKSEKTNGLRLLDDRIAVVRDEALNKSAGGIVIPDAVQEKMARGTVKTTGTGRRLDNGQRRPMEVKDGDRVVFNAFAGFPVKSGGVEYLLLNEGDVLAILPE